MTTMATRACMIAVLVLSMLATSSAADVEAFPPIDFDPPMSDDMLLHDLAHATRAASQWLLEVDEQSMTVWVWRAPDDPDPEDVFADNAWVGDATRGVTRRDLHETMLRNVEYYAPFFDQADPTWSYRG